MNKLIYAETIKQTPIIKTNSSQRTDLLLSIKTMYKDLNIFVCLTPVVIARMIGSPVMHESNVLQAFL